MGPFAYTGSATLTYPTDQVDLVLGAGYVDFAAPPGAGQNQQNVVAGIDNYITGGGTLPTGFANLGNLSGPAFSTRSPSSTAKTRPARRRARSS